ncbi:MFS transporter [Cupriavidus plantarum]|uniref:MFS transporter n=1 Tax=Cupriavidus plantarum TaxID=942865 RepID=UPI00339D8C57
MTLRLAIIVMTACGVISDAILIAFYPQFFDMRYGVTDTVHIGAYVAAISVAVMITLPMWARVAYHVETLHLVVVTQGIAGLLGLASLGADTIAAFWAVTMLMFMTKSSYLLMFPYLMRVERLTSHGATVGLLAVVVHLGGIFGAMAGGVLLQHFGTDACLTASAAGDFAQMALCVQLIRTGRIVPVLGMEDVPAPPPPALHRTLPRVLRLGALMLVFDFSAYLVRPFFSVYWQAATGVDSQMLTGLVFAIPGLMALLALSIDRRAGGDAGSTGRHLSVGAAGLLLQASPWPTAMLIGRCLFGWALFRISVRLDVTLFRVSTPQAYARDFSIANGCQNLGVLLSSFCAGVIVDRFGMAMPFLIAAAGLLLTLLMSRLIFRIDRFRVARLPTTGTTGSTEHVI